MCCRFGQKDPRTTEQAIFACLLCDCDLHSVKALRAHIKGGKHIRGERNKRKRSQLQEVARASEAIALGGRQSFQLEQKHGRGRDPQEMVGSSSSRGNFVNWRTATVKKSREDEEESRASSPPPLVAPAPLERGEEEDVERLHMSVPSVSY